MKAAKFGGKFEVKKTKRVTTTTDVTDFRKEMQKSMNKMVGTAKSEFNVGSAINFIYYNIIINYIIKIIILKL